MKSLLKRAGFADITQNPNGTFNATINGTRYEGLCLQSATREVEDPNLEDCVKVPLTLLAPRSQPKCTITVNGQIIGEVQNWTPSDKEEQREA